MTGDEPTREISRGQDDLDSTPLANMASGNTVAETTGTRPNVPVPHVYSLDGSNQESTHVTRRSSSSSLVALSFAQERLWVVDQIYPKNAAYNIAGRLLISGPLHIEVLQRCIEEIIRRHETLRTRFQLVDSEPYQHIAAATPFILETINVSRLPIVDRLAEIECLVQAEAQVPFDLTMEPLVRIKLVCLDDTKHELLITLHHSIADGWSLDILTQELAALYDAFVHERPSPLDELPVQYADFANWQRHSLVGSTFENHLNYWKQQLANSPTALDVPTRHSRPSIQSFNGATTTFSLPQQLFASLTALSRTEHVTLFMTTLAAFFVLMSHYTEQEDLVIGTPIAGRTFSELEGLVGFFVNMLPLRVDLADDPPFRVFLERVREMCLDAFIHQEVPFEQLVEAVKPERDLSRNPLVQVVFALQNTPNEPVQSGDLTFQLREHKNGTSPFDLFMELREISGEMCGQCTYSTDLFDEDMILQLIQHYKRLLEGIVSAPWQVVSHLPMLSAVERRRILLEWSGASTSYPRDHCIHQLFEIGAARTPEAIALMHNDKSLSYAELDWRSNQLARYLRKFGVAPESLVGVCLDRSFEMIITLLGVLKAGGAYVPLDSSYPHERLAYMIDDAEITVFVTQEELLTHLPTSGIRSICFENSRQLIELESGSPLNEPIDPTNLAYLMYTSGSTGKPKGVAVPHRAVVRLVRDTNYTTFSPDETFLQFAPLAFDASTFEIWGPLLNGGRLVIFPQERANLDKLGEVIESYGVTTAWLTAGLFHAMVDRDVPALRLLHHLLAGGDVLSMHHVRQMLASAPSCLLTNGYGPTENTTFATFYPITHSDSQDPDVPIGRPISNSQVYILDRYLNPAPVGIPGELYIGGDGLARGYFHSPALTAERFVPHPFSNVPGARLYRSGDIVRYRADGNIEFLGRRDNQVKVRGFRIEMGEIETAIRQHAYVDDCLVTAKNLDRTKKHSSSTQEKLLIAYILLANMGDKHRVEQEVKPVHLQEELRTFLRERLPDYMIPSVFVILDAWPLTETGKLDRQSLPTPTLTSEESTKANIGDHTPTEKKLIEIWEEVLGVQIDNVNDNFFELGGHSLLASRVVSRISAIFGTEVPLRLIFDAPTVGELATIVEGYSQQVEQNQISKVALDSTSAKQLLDNLDNLTDDEVEDLLRQMRYSPLSKPLDAGS